MGALGSGLTGLGSVLTAGEPGGGGGGCDFNIGAQASLRIVRCVFTANVTLSGAQTSDGITTNPGDRALVAGNTIASQNGIYVTAAGAWTRAADFNDGSQMSAGTRTYVSGGTTWKYSEWVLTNLGAIVIGTTSLVFKPNGVDLDPVAALGTATAATIGAAVVSIINNQTVNLLGEIRAFSEVLVLRGINSGFWLGGVGFRGLTDVTGWLSLPAAQGKMTGIPSQIDIGGAFPGALGVTADLNNFKMYGFDAQPGGTWKCWSEAFTALARGTNLTDANQTIQPFTDKCSRYERVTALTANRNTTLGVTGVLAGTVVDLVRHDNAAFTNAIINGGGGAGTIFTFPASQPNCRLTARFDGTNWENTPRFAYIEP